MRSTKSLLAMLLIALLTACGAPAANAPAANAPAEGGTTVRLGFIPVIIFAPIYMAIERGYFAEEQITIALTPIQNTNEAVVQLAAGNFDVALSGGNAGVFNAIHRGLQFKIVAPMHNERQPMATPLVISAKRADEIKSVADLKGKRIGINGNGAAIEYWVGQALAKHGLSIKDVETKAMPFPDMPAALESGSLDAAVITDPLVTINEQKGLVKVLADDFIDGFTATYVFMGKEWLDANPQVARGFVKAYLRACKDLQGDYMTPEVAKIVEKYTKIPAAVVEKSRLAHYQPDGTIPVKDLEALQQFFLERGFLEYNELMDVNTFVDTSLVKEAVK